MQVSIESGEGLERRMTVKLPSERLDNEVNKRLKRIARTARLDGFRPGKVPLTIVKQRYSGAVRQEVFGELIESTFHDALKQQDLKPAGEPKIEPIDAKVYDGPGYTAVFEVLPEFDLSDVSHIAIKRPVAQVTDEDVDSMIEKLRKQRITWSQVDRPAARDDRVKISFRGTIDGEAFEGGEAKDVPLVLGSKTMIEGFEEGLLGASVGDTRKLDVKFPDDYPEERLAGKPVAFEVSLSEVSEPLLPELTEEFAKSFGIADGSAETLRNDIRGSMERELQQRIKARLKTQVMDALFDANKFDLPAVLIDREISRMQERARSQATNSPVAGNMELPREMYEQQAIRWLALGLIVNKIVAQNDIKVDADRVRETIEAAAAEYEDPDEVVKWYYGNKDHLSTVELRVLEEQAVDWMLGQVSVEDEPITFNALTESAQG
jgi:trigger factor